MNNSTGIIPFITFSRCTEEAVNYYVTVFPDSEINTIEYYREGQRGYEKGMVLNASFKLMGRPFMAMDFNEPGNPPLNWAISFYINCNSEAMFDDIFGKLSPFGKVLMGPEAVFNIRKAAWITDKYGVTWQIIWE